MLDKWLSSYNNWANFILRSLVGLAVPLPYPPGGEVLRTALAPVPLRLYAAGRLAFRLSASSLTRSDSRIRTKPVAANTTGSLSRIGHDGTIITTPYLRRVQINGRWTLLASMGRSSFISAEGLPTLIASVCLPPECEVQFEVGNVRLGTMYTSR